MTDDLDRVLADIDTLLPPGAPSVPAGVEPWEAEAMRWEPVDHDDHPDRPTGGTTTHTARVTLQRTTPETMVNEWLHSAYEAPLPPADEPDRPDRAGVLIERSGWHMLTWPGLERAFRDAAEYERQAVRDAMLSLVEQPQHTTTHLQHLRDRTDQAQAVIDAHRHRNTGPANPAGIDGRARRHQHPTKAPARNAQPATQGAATPFVRAWLDAIGDPEPWPTVVLARRGDGTLVVGFDGAGHGPAPDAVWVDEPWDVGL